MQVRSRLPNSRVVATSPATADTVGKELRIRYKSGESIRQVADETGYGIARVRGLLERTGTTFRARTGCPPGTPGSGARLGADRDLGLR